MHAHTLGKPLFHLIKRLPRHRIGLLFCHKKFERIKNPEPGAKDGTFHILKYNPDELSRKCKKLFKKDKNGRIIKTSLLDELINKLF